MKAWAHNLNKDRYQETYETVRAHIHYAAYAGRYTWTEDTTGWPKEKAQYIRLRLTEEGFYVDEFLCISWLYTVKEKG